MSLPLRLLVPSFLLSLAACGDDAAGSDTGTTGGTSSDTGSTGTSESSSSGGSTSSTSSDTTGGSSSSDGGSTTGADTTDGGSTTGDPLGGFERFLLTSAAGPCPPEADCDGFIELLADGTLRVETFGDVSETVVEAAISDEDLTAAAAVFSDPALLALLDGSDPVCKPPTDIYESMTAEVDGVSHDAGTTFCDQPPVTAAREMAIGLAETYAP